MYHLNDSFREKFKNIFMIGGTNTNSSVSAPAPAPAPPQSSGIDQYSQYGVHKDIVEAMVDHDDIRYVEPFYESLSSGILNVEYIDDFYEALRKINSNTFGKGVIASRIQIVNQDHIDSFSVEGCSCSKEGIICNDDRFYKVMYLLIDNVQCVDHMYFRSPR